MKYNDFYKNNEIDLYKSYLEGILISV